MIIRRSARPRLALAHLVAVGAAGACLAHPAVARAQRGSGPASAAGPAVGGPTVGPYERARRLVEQGQGALGRAVADSLVAASPAGSPALAEALWWRATLSADGARAEQDLRRVVDEFPTSPRVGDATVRLAQLDISRDRPDVAAPTLARLVRERPDDPARAQAAYWLARARLELGDMRGTCVALADAAAALRGSEAATRQQIGDLRRRLPACDPTSAVTAMPPGTTSPAALEALAAEAQQAAARAAAAAPAAPPSNATAATASAPSPATTAGTTTAGATPGFTIIEASPRAAAPKAVPFEQRAPQRVAAAKPAAAAKSTPPVVAKPAPAAAASVATVAAPAAPKAAAPAEVAAAPTATPAASATSAADAGAYAVQVAAYAQRDPAESLADRLRARGLDARVTGSAAPFRVKLGRFPTRAAAAAARATFAGQGLAGFVTDAGDGPRRP